MMKSILVFIISLIFPPLLLASDPLTCMNIAKIESGWVSGITITNQCGQPIDVHDSIIQFKSNKPLSGNYWGEFAPLTYPENPTLINEVTQSGYLIKIPLTFPVGDQWWKPTTVLPVGSKITIRFSSTPETTIDSLLFYPIITPVVRNGKLGIQFGASPISGISAPSKVTISNGTNYNKIISGQWNKTITINSIPYGSYQISVQSLKSGGISWIGTAQPTKLTINSDIKQIVKITYKKQPQYGSVSIDLNESKPEEGLQDPVLEIKNLTTGQWLPVHKLIWSNKTTVSNLLVGNRYQMAIDNLYGLHDSYVAELSPTNTVTIQNTSNTPLSLTFKATPLPTVSIPLHIFGLPDNQTAVITATDDKGYVYALTISNANSKLWLLPANRQYQFYASGVHSNGSVYQALISPSKLLIQTTSPEPIIVAYTAKTAVTEISAYVDVTLNDVTVWDNNSNSLQPLGLLDIVNRSDVKALHLAFITAANGCNGNWNGYPVSADSNGFGIDVFKKLQSQGVKLTFALGGLNGTYLEQACTSTEDLVNAYKTIIAAYKPDALDFDIENSMQTNNAQLDRMMQALLQIQQQHPEIPLTFTLPVMPFGLVSGVGENVIARAKANGLNNYSVNIMAMDYGPSFTEKTMSAYAIEAAHSTFNQLKKYYPNADDTVLWHRIGITPMIGLNDTIPLNFSVADIAVLKQFAVEKSLGLLSFWSINRDKPCGSPYVSNTCTSTNPKTGAPNQTFEYQYIKGFNQ